MVAGTGEAVRTLEQLGQTWEVLVAKKRRESSGKGREGLMRKEHIQSNIFR